MIIEKNMAVGDKKEIKKKKSAIASAKPLATEASAGKAKEKPAAERKGLKNQSRLIIMLQ